MIQIALKLLPPEEAIAYFRQKGYRIAFDHRDVWQQEHAAAFTVAKAMSIDLLADIRAAVDAALAAGTTLEQFRAALIPLLRARGWWGVQPVVDPLTGETVQAQLGSPRRLKVIYDTNLRTAHAEGHWRHIESAKGVLPYLMYDHTPSRWERPEHAAWDGLVLRVDHPWWKSHFPVKAWGCKCRAIQLSDRQLERLGVQPTETPPADALIEYTNERTGETQWVPAGVDPAFNYPPGARLASLAQTLLDKCARVPADLGAAGAQAAGEAIAQLMPEWTRWLNAVEARRARDAAGPDGGAPAGAAELPIPRRTIGAVPPAAVERPAGGAPAAPLSSAGISIHGEDAAALLPGAGAGAIPLEFAYGLPEHLAAPHAIFRRSSAAGRPDAVLYVWRTADADRYLVATIELDRPLAPDSPARTNALTHIVVRSRSELLSETADPIQGSI